MAFDYGFTCPDINKSIDQFKSVVSDYLSNMLDDCCPMLVGEQKQEFIKSYSDQIYQEFESNFEDVRKTNEDMRKEAEKQIEYAEERLETSEQTNSEYSEKIQLLEDQISELESELELSQP